jgi:hypothetical protein
METKEKEIRRKTEKKKTRTGEALVANRRGTEGRKTRSALANWRKNKTAHGDRLRNCRRSDI